MSQRSTAGLRTEMVNALQKTTFYDPSFQAQMVVLGCGEGYPAFCFSSLATDVVAMDRDPLRVCVGRRLQTLFGVKNVRLLQSTSEALARYLHPNHVLVVMVDDLTQNERGWLTGYLHAHSEAVYVLTCNEAPFHDLPPLQTLRISDGWRIYRKTA